MDTRSWLSLYRATQTEDERNDVLHTLTNALDSGSSTFSLRSWVDLVCAFATTCRCWLPRTTRTSYCEISPCKTTIHPGKMALLSHPVSQHILSLVYQGNNPRLYHQLCHCCYFAKGYYDVVPGYKYEHGPYDDGFWAAKNRFPWAYGPDFQGVCMNGMITFNIKDDTQLNTTILYTRTTLNQLVISRLQQTLNERYLESCISILSRRLAAPKVQDLADSLSRDKAKELLKAALSNPMWGLMLLEEPKRIERLHGIALPNAEPERTY